MQHQMAAKISLSRFFHFLCRDDQEMSELIEAYANEIDFKNSVENVLNRAAKARRIKKES